MNQIKEKRVKFASLAKNSVKTLVLSILLTNCGDVIREYKNIN